MVKKKQVVKKKTGKVRMTKKLKIKPIQKSPEQVQRDLKFFTKGVERLKELEGELNSLDTRGFYREEQTIRSKLKNVSDIPIIESAIKNLRLRINKKYKPKHKKKSPYKQIVENIDEIMKGVPEIQEHFIKLRVKMKNVPKLNQKKKKGLGNSKAKEKRLIKQNKIKLEKRRSKEILKRKSDMETKFKEFKCPKCGDVVSFESTAISESGRKICSACKLIENFK